MPYPQIKSVRPSLSVRLGLSIDACIITCTLLNFGKSALENHVEKP
jgi:hypothetical protein